MRTKELRRDLRKVVEALEAAEPWNGKFLDEVEALLKRLYPEETHGYTFPRSKTDELVRYEIQDWFRFILKGKSFDQRVQILMKLQNVAITHGVEMRSPVVIGCIEHKREVEFGCAISNVLWEQHDSGFLEQFDNRLNHSWIRQPNLRDSPLALAESLGFRNNWHHRKIIEPLEGSTRSLLLLPRFAGKSTYAGIIGPAWKLGRDRRHTFLIISHTMDYAKSFLRDIVRIMETHEPYIEAFGRLKPKTPSKWADNEIIVEGVKQEKEPSIAVLGVGASLIGRHPKTIIIDDVIDRRRAESEARSRDIEEWYRSELIPCLGKDQQLFVIGTRWRWNDLYSQLLKNEKFQCLEIPAILDRKAVERFRLPEAFVDQSYWPELWPLERLLARKKEIGIYAWMSQYMNDPSLEEGAVFNPNWLEYYEHPPLREKLRIIQAVDLAIGEKSTADYFVIATIGITAEGDIYLLDFYRAHLDVAAQIKAIEAQAAAWKPEAIGIEAVAYQGALVQFLKPMMLPTREIKQTRDKILRIQSLVPYFESGRVKISKSHEDFIIEYCQFPRGDHDDLLDAFEMAVSLALQPKFVPGFGILEW